MLGVDRYAPPHAWGSSHGGSRIIRLAYFEGDHYIPLLRRAYALWRELEAGRGSDLLHVTGGLTAGHPDGPVASGARQAAERYGLACEVLTPRSVRDRFPLFRLPDDHVAVYEPDAGWLDPEACIRAHLEAAEAHGALVRTDAPVLEWQREGDGVSVTTPHGTVHAARLVLAAGGWLADLVPDLAPDLRIERQVNAWFAPQRPAEAARGPVYIWEPPSGPVLYGFPDRGTGLKAGLHHGGEEAGHPDVLDRAVRPEDLAALRATAERLLPGALGEVEHAAICFYTNTPDGHFLLDRHPMCPQVVIASACSGHGFKASSAIGEAAAELAVGERTGLDLGAFGLARFKNT